MAEAAPEFDKQRASFEQSQKIRDVVSVTIEATRKIGGAIMKVAGDILGMFRR